MQQCLQYFQDHYNHIFSNVNSLEAMLYADIDLPNNQFHGTLNMYDQFFLLFGLYFLRIVCLFLLILCYFSSMLRLGGCLRIYIISRHITNNNFGLNA